ncbi:MAG: multiheme c-type cytochrome [Flavobacteriaceae bacterium]|nr:multiheme c-type cytochrome [Flavobacteriaceae bacterium]
MIKVMRFLFLILIGTLTFSCVNHSSEFIPLSVIAKHTNGLEYVGMNSCIECHPQIVASHLQTSHYNTSKPFRFELIEEAFIPNNNLLSFGNGDLIKFTQKERAAFQEGYLNQSENPVFKKSMDLIIGSGNKIGRSFLNWEDTSLLQLQGSHFSPLNQWINSPGYTSALSPMRPIFPRCLECHTTYARPENPSSATQNNRYVKNQIIYGIDCQRCHGEVVKHVNYQRKNRLDTVGKYITRYANFSQDQRISMCALCHSGTGQESSIKSFSFQAGDELTEFISTNYKTPSSNKLDVHANQVGLLMASMCFQKSKKMDCMTCHDPHKTERGMEVKFNNICISCHQGIKHNQNTTLKTPNLSDCISCHMPLENSKTMKLELEKENLQPVKVRSHLIGINPNLTSE